MSTPSSSPAARLLIVDDEEPILFSLESYFAGAGFLVRCARAISDAVALAAAESFDVVIADVMLTTSDEAEGILLLERLRSKGPRPRVILLTAFGTEEMERAAKARGAAAFLHKPQSLAELERVVRALLPSTDPRPGSELEAQP